MVINNHIYYHLNVFYLDLIIDLLNHLLYLAISNILLIAISIFILIDLMVIQGNGSEPNWMDMNMTGSDVLT